MEQKQHKKRPWLFFILLIAGLASVSLWQNIAQSTDKTEDGQVLKNLTPEESYKLIQDHKEHENFVILDVRTSKEFKQARLDNAVNLDFYEKSFKKELAKLEKENIYLVYCRSGNRSGRTLKLMKELGFQEVYNMSGGIGTWAAKKLPFVQ